MINLLGRLGVFWRVVEHPPHRFRIASTSAEAIERTSSWRVFAPGLSASTTRIVVMTCV